MPKQKTTRKPQKISLIRLKKKVDILDRYSKDQRRSTTNKLNQTEQERTAIIDQIERDRKENQAKQAELETKINNITIEQSTQAQRIDSWANTTTTKLSSSTFWNVVAIVAMICLAGGITLILSALA